MDLKNRSFLQEFISLSQFIVYVGNYVAGIFLGMCQAFDSVPHENLKSTINNFEIGRFLLDLIFGHKNKKTALNMLLINVCLMQVENYFTRAHQGSNYYCIRACIVILLYLVAGRCSLSIPLVLVVSMIIDICRFWVQYQILN